MTVECLQHDWSVRALELTRDGVWTEEVCRSCGDERAVRPSRAAAPALVALPYV
jgi:hypothetical protein